MQQENEENYCTLYLVRHGETEWNVKSIIQGQLDSPLTTTGLEQAKETSEKLKNINFDAIFSSDLPRALRTAEIIKLDRELVIQTSKLLREQSFGSFEGKHAEEFRKMLKDKLKEKEILSETEYASLKVAPDVETDEELTTRFINQLREIAVAYPGRKILVVTHGGCIKTFLIKMGYAKKDTFQISPFKNGGYVRLISDGVDFFIKEVDGLRKTTNNIESV